MQQKSDRYAVVTGASSGLGKAAALGLAKQNRKVFLVSKDEVRGWEALREIQLKSSNRDVFFLPADLSSQKSIHVLADRIGKELPQIDLLFHAAGVMLPKRILTADGLEMTFAVNHLAPFLLTQKLMPLLRSSPSARIITLTSRAEELASIDFDDLQGEKKYSLLKSYGQSKLANILFTYELSRRLKETRIVANCCHPGMVDTNLPRHLPKFFRTLIKCLRPFASTPEEAIKPAFRLATDPQFEKTTGKYYRCSSEKKSSARSYDLLLSMRLWSASERLLIQYQG